MPLPFRRHPWSANVISDFPRLFPSARSTVVLYEAPHRVARTLRELAEAHGGTPDDATQGDGDGPANAAAIESALRKTAVDRSPQPDVDSSPPPLQQRARRRRQQEQQQTLSPCLSAANVPPPSDSRPLLVCREMTKPHEEFRRFPSLSTAAAAAAAVGAAAVGATPPTGLRAGATGEQYTATAAASTALRPLTLLGEFTLVLLPDANGGHSGVLSPNVLTDALALVRTLTSAPHGRRPSEAVTRVAALTGVPRSALFRAVLEDDAAASSPGAARRASGSGATARP
jgi:hypothetical protein